MPCVVDNNDGNSGGSNENKQDRQSTDQEEEKQEVWPVPLVLAGCVPQAERSLSELKGLGDGVSLVSRREVEIKK